VSSVLSTHLRSWDDVAFAGRATASDDPLADDTWVIALSTDGTLAVGGRLKPLGIWNHAVKSFVVSGGDKFDGPRALLYDRLGMQT